MSNHQNHDLRDCLTTAIQAPFYRKLCDEGVELNADDLSSFPLLTRNAISENVEQLLLQPLAERTSLQFGFTTGTTGHPLKVVRSQADLDRENSCLASFIDETLGSSTWRDGRYFHLTLNPESSSWTSTAPWGTAGRVTKWSIHNLHNGHSSQIRRALSEFRHGIIAIMPSVALVLAELLPLAGLADGDLCRLVILSGEACSESDRKFLLGRISSRITSVYSMAEFGIIGFERSQPGWHWIDRNRFFLELLGSHGQPVDNGSTGEIVLTALQTQAMRLVRYRTGDEGRIMAQEPDAVAVQLTRSRVTERPSSGLSTSSVEMMIRKPLAQMGCRHFSVSRRGNCVDLTIERDNDEIFSNLAINQIRFLIARWFGCQVIFNGQIMDEHAKLTDVLSTLVRNVIQNLSIDASRVAAIFLHGSTTEGSLISKYSDVDIMIVVRSTDDWIAGNRLASSILANLSRASVSVESLETLSTLDRLVAARLRRHGVTLYGQRECLGAVGNLSENVAGDALFWARNLNAQIVMHWPKWLSDNKDAALCAYVISKVAITARRYMELAAGGNEFTAEAILRKLETRSLVNNAVFDRSRYYYECSVSLTLPEEFSGVLVESTISTVTEILGIHMKYFSRHTGRLDRRSFRSWIKRGLERFSPP